MKNDDRYQYQSRGLLYSVVGHVALLLSFIIGDLLGPAEFGPETIYSITLEGGAQLGGQSQVPKKDNKEKPAPLKMVSEKSEQKPVNTEEVKEVKKVEPPEEKPEVSTNTEPPKPEPKKVEEKKEETKKIEPPKKVEEKPKEEKKSAKETKVDTDKEYQKAMQRYLGESTDAGGQGFGAGKIGGQGMGGGEQRPPEFFTYRDMIKRTIKKNWNWFDTSTSLRAQITFAVSPTGELSEVAIVRSSGNSLFDNSVIRAVMKSSPLPPPPESVYQWFKLVRTEFDPQE